jgi:uncharacterized protein YjlB
MDRANTNPHIDRYVLKPNKGFPNNKLPVLIYRNAIQLPEQKNRAANIAQKLFIRNGWSNSWRDGIYDFHHFHSNVHECMAVCIGFANVILGGPNGKRIKLKQGDVIILPAGLGHRCVSKSDDFFCVGAYPEGKDYDIKTGLPKEFTECIRNIEKVPIPKYDPVFGDQGFLKVHWK